MNQVRTQVTLKFQSKLLPATWKWGVQSQRLLRKIKTCVKSIIPQSKRFSSSRMNLLVKFQAILKLQSNLQEEVNPLKRRDLRKNYFGNKTNGKSNSLQKSTTVRRNSTFLKYILRNLRSARMTKTCLGSTQNSTRKQSSRLIATFVLR